LQGGLASLHHDPPDDVEEVMADIATVFHWPPSAFDDMGLNDLMGWHDKALKRLKAKLGVT
jgi:hypothetical protein